MTQIELNLNAKQVNRQHSVARIGCLTIASRNTCDISTVWILNPMARDLSTTVLVKGILIPIVAQNEPSNVPKQLIVYRCSRRQSMHPFLLIKKQTEDASLLISI